MIDQERKRFEAELTIAVGKHYIRRVVERIRAVKAIITELDAWFPRVVPQYRISAAPVNH